MDIDVGMVSHLFGNVIPLRMLPDGETPMRRAALALLASTSLSTPAIANSVGPFNWTGFYVGAHAGYSWGSITGNRFQSVVTPSTFTGPGITVTNFERTLEPEGGLGGLHAGYNIQFGPWVAGLEADIFWTGQDSSFQLITPRRSLVSEEYIYQETVKAEVEYAGTFRARLGHAFGPFLPYVTAGFGWAHVSASINSSLREFTFLGVTPINSVNIVAAQSQTLVGWTLGAGFEYAFSPQWSARAEYLHIDLGEEAFFTGSRGGHYGLRDHIARVGISYRIGP